ncbi:MAG: outer membrane protein assembly factor BamA [Candidatus Hydrogenedentes bacterium]|nr:outer membrane protein assembly factor BamA [Candidatus Hydrogenedentota bacterium]
MRKVAIGLLGLGWILLVPPVSAQEYAGKTIKSVLVAGLKGVSESMVRSQIQVQPGQTFNPRAIARDIRRLYETGHFTSIKADAQLEDEQIVLIYIVQEKRLIDEIKIIGNDRLRMRHIRGVLTWQEGDPFVAEQYDQEREALIKLYQSKGFPNASVDIVVEEVSPSRVRVTYSIQEGRKARIRSIRFEGNTILSDRKLRKLMATKRSKWRFLGGKYDEARFDDDLQKIIDEYGNYGRLEMEILNTDLSYSESGKGMLIEIHVSEGPEYQVESVETAGNQVFDTDEIERIVKVHAGNVHNKGQVEKDAGLVKQGYEDSGYVTASTTPQVTLDREKKTTHVVHRVNEGDLKYVKEIKVTGNSVTKDEVVRRELLTIPGERFDGGLVRASQRRLENTRYFEKERFSLEPVEEDERFTNLLVDVEEGKTGNFNFGGGYSTEEKFGGFAEIRLNNFDIRNWPTFSGGGQQFVARLQLGDIRNEYNLSFTDPEIAGYPLAFGIDLFDESYEYREGTDFTQETRGGQLRLGKILSPFVTARNALRYREIDIGDFTTFGWPTLQRERGQQTTISSVWGIARNTLDSNRDPSSGARHDLELEIAGLGGDYHFFKLEHDSTWYKALGEEKKWVLSFRAREGWANEYGSSDFVPIADRFFVGGTTTVRGYDQRDIGPKEKQFILFGEKEAIGGELRLVDNLEMKYKLTEQFRLYAFVDAGGVWSTSSDFDLGDMRYSAGLGFGVDIPRLGPVRIDYGFPLNPDEDQGSGKLHLLTGLRF